MPSKFWLNLEKNVKLGRLLGNWMPPELKRVAKCQTFQSAGQPDALQALVEIATYHTTLQSSW